MATFAFTTAHADVVTFSGTTSGTFTFNNTGNDLTFTGNPMFTGETNSAGEASFSDLGSFDLGPTPGTYDGSEFTLTIMFTSPPGTGLGTFMATVKGTVDTDGGGVRIRFDNDIDNPMTFTTANGGSFQFYLARDVFVGIPANAVLSGGVLNAKAGNNVPDNGSTVALLGMALVGAAALRRKLAA